MTDRTSYDEVPYDSRPFFHSQPDHLAVLGSLLGLSPKSPDCAKVLELGCSAGNNIIPLAYQFPQSSFVGIDNSQRELSEGRSLLAELGISNLELRELDILKITPELGLFDYIICHGVLSWVPPPVQKKIFEVCRKNLAPNGIIYLSYNTFPGWFLRGTIREMLIQHTNQFNDPQEKIAQAKIFADFLARHISSSDAAQDRFLRATFKAVAELPNYYLFHDLLEEVNYPFYFSQVYQAAQEQGLSYLADAEVQAAMPREMNEREKAALGELAGNPLRVELYTDFLRVRTFRRSLFCREQDAPSSRKIQAERTSKFFIATALTEEPSENADQSTVRFVAEDGNAIETKDPVLQAAVRILSQRYPETIAFNDLLVLVRQALGPQGGKKISAMDLIALLLRCYFAGLVEFRYLPVPVTSTIGERPKVWEFARLQSQREKSVTNLRHCSITLEGCSAQFVKLLDGTRNNEQLAQILAQLIQENPQDFQLDPSSTTERVLELALEKLLRASLLLA